MLSGFTGLQAWQPDVRLHTDTVGCLHVTAHRALEQQGAPMRRPRQVGGAGLELTRLRSRSCWPISAGA